MRGVHSCTSPNGMIIAPRVQCTPMGYLLVSLAHRGYPPLRGRRPVIWNWFLRFSKIAPPSRAPCTSLCALPRAGARVIMSVVDNVHPAPLSAGEQEFWIMSQVFNAPVRIVPHMDDGECVRSVQRLWSGSAVDSEALRRARVIQEHISPRNGGAETGETP